MKQPTYRKAYSAQKNEFPVNLPPVCSQQSLTPVMTGWDPSFVGGADYLGYGGMKKRSAADVNESTGTQHKSSEDQSAPRHGRIVEDHYCADFERLSVMELRGKEFSLSPVSEETKQTYNLERNVVFDMSIQSRLVQRGWNALPVVNQKEKWTWCVNEPSKEPTVILTGGFLLIDSTVWCAEHGEVLFNTQSLRLKFGGDLTQLTGPAITLGTRWNKAKNSDDDVKAGAKLPLAVSTDMMQEKAKDGNGVEYHTFVRDFILSPDFAKQTVSVWQVKESHTHGQKRLIYRPNRDADWEVIKSETAVLLTDGCQFFLEHPEPTRQGVYVLYPIRSEMFTYVDTFVHGNKCSGLVEEENRLYSYRVTRECAAVTPFAVERVVLYDIISDWTSAKVKKYWGDGVEAVNTYYKNFGIEYLEQKIEPENMRILQYEVITVDMVHGPPRSGRSGFAAKDTRTHEQKFFWAIFVYLYRRYPKKHWMILQVTGEGNCFFHCLAVWFAIMFPGQTELHYYDWLRQQICDVLIANIDNLTTPRNIKIGFLELFQRLTERPGDPEDMDLRGLNPPVEPSKKKMETPHAYELRRKAGLARKNAYIAKCKKNHGSIRKKYINAVNQSRQNCVFNTEMQVEALPLLVNHILSVAMYDSTKAEIIRDPTVAVPFHAEEISKDRVIHVFLDPITGAKHYVSAIESQFVAGFQAPDYPPKNTMTHDEYGNHW